MGMNSLTGTKCGAAGRYYVQKKTEENLRGKSRKGYTREPQYQSQL